MSDAADRMDDIYRWQHHIYDASRKFYLLGRDGLIANLAPPPGGYVLEIGCGTGRNLIRAARRYPDVHLYGLDVSAVMLGAARSSVRRAGLERRVALRLADASAFDARALFGRAQFDRVFISYALSMIPPWERVLEKALDSVAPGGSLHVIDFGDQAGLPGWFGALLDRWLARFHVQRRQDLQPVLARLAATRGLSVSLTSRLRGYVMDATVERPAGTVDEGFSQPASISRTAASRSNR